MELTKMLTYKPSTPRLPLGLLALAMTAITIGSFVVVPASTEAVVATCRAPLTATAEAAVPRSDSL
jgi:hypothetical protein